MDTTTAGGQKYIGLVQSATGATLIRDPNTTPPWNDISTLPGYPAGVTSVSLTTTPNSNGIHVTVRGPGDSVFQATCTISPVPGTGGNPAWPGNCTAFTNFTPPLFAGPRAVDAPGRVPASRSVVSLPVRGGDRGTGQPQVLGTREKMNQKG